MNFDFQPHEIIENFTIVNTSKALQKSNIFITREIDAIINEIEIFPKNTGIMIGNFIVAEKLDLLVFVFDDHAIILDQTSLFKFQTFLDKCSNKTQIFFLNSQSEKIIKDLNSNKFNQSNIEEIFLKNENISKIIIEIKKWISVCIIKKSQIRTKIRHTKSKSEKISVNFLYQLSDFIEIKKLKQSVILSFNVKDQFLYILKKK